jgi:transglutaminase-like putative cysteine protease
LSTHRNKAGMVRLEFSIELSYQIASPACDFVFMVHAARTPRQHIVEESLHITPPVAADVHLDLPTQTRVLRLSAAGGPLKLNYGATVDIDHQIDESGPLGEVPVRHLPAAVLPYLYPSRYCQSDRLQRLALKEFGHLTPGYGRAQAICDWVSRRVTFTSNSSTAETSALDTLIDEAGVCRDFAHLMIALCRAVNLPARFASGIDYGADPALGPPDFHAYVEVFIGRRWYMFDPSGTAIPMGFVRMATGRDAADCAFATMFGAVDAAPPVITIEALPNAGGELILPQRRLEALSTADEAGD